MASAVIMPRQGQSVETCIITHWAKKKGDRIMPGDILFSYETDKASFDAEAQHEGTLIEVFFQEGDEVPVLANVAVIGQPGEDTTPFLPASRPSEAPMAAGESNRHAEPEPAVETAMATAETAHGKIRISPRAKAMARKLGIDTVSMRGTGPNGRIIARDIEKAGSEATRGATAGLPVEKPPLITSAGYAAAPGMAFEEIPVTNIRKRIGRAMHESISLSAQLTHHISANVSALLALRNQVKAGTAGGSTMNVTLNDMICFCVIRALEKNPALNSHFLGEHTRIFKKVHLGIAVDTPRGLMVPAVQNASDLTLRGLSDRIREVADQCRSGSINPDLLASTAASFTVSNLGNYGVEMFTPIINLPQIAILGVNTITHRPADLGNGIFGFIPVVGLSLTYDHRAVDGGPATLFLKEIKDQVEHFHEKL
jgi:pyruvate dehydrogenase E2 component (dihydrolipoamide acetyltransferase)